MKALWIIAVVVWSIIFAFAAIVGYLWWTLPDLAPSVTVVPIHSETLNETLYIKKTVRGLMGDYRVIVISRSCVERFEPDPSFEYVYPGTDLFFFRFADDTLLVYCQRESEVPPYLTTGIVIKQIDKSQPAWKDLPDTYFRRGIRTIKVPQEHVAK